MLHLQGPTFKTLAQAVSLQCKGTSTLHGDRGAAVLLPGPTAWASLHVCAQALLMPAGGGVCCAYRGAAEALQHS